MTATAAVLHQPLELSERLDSLLPRFAARAQKHDDSDAFVTDNYAELRAARLFSAGVPVELGGDGLDAAELCDMLRGMAPSCASTALALSMHTHIVALLAWRWRNQKAPVDAILARIAKEQIVLVSSGGSDWLDSGGVARKTEGGFLIDAVKGFASGVEEGTFLNTSAVYDDPEQGPTVLHFMLPLTAKGVTVERNWRAMGMRATGSHVVRAEGFFLADASIAAKRPRGLWHPLFHLISMLAIPIIYSVYMGVGESLSTAALATARRRPMMTQLVDQVGAVETELAGARFAFADMTAATAGTPGPETTNRVYLARSNLVRRLMAGADAAMTLAGGGGFMRSQPVERAFRDLQGARHHPLNEHAQRDLAGRIALGLPIDGPIVTAA